MAQSNDPNKPDACPKCGSKKLASILYGLPMFDEELERRLSPGGHLGRLLRLQGRPDLAMP